MNDSRFYFDWAATAPFDKEILEKSFSLSLSCWANPSSLHDMGSKAKDALEDARKRSSIALGVEKDTIYFTSGGTESDWLPMLSLLSRPQKGSIVIGKTEHPAAREMAKSMKNAGWDAIFVSPDRDGFIQGKAVAETIREDTALVCVMLVNNETGAIQPLKEIVEAVKEKTKGKRQPLFHADCVQAAGKIPLNLPLLGIDSAAISAHKIGGPRGSGLLYLAKPFTPFLRGGGQEKGVRSGTENLFAAEAMALCLEKYAINEKNIESQKRFALQKEMTSHFILELSKIEGCVLVPKNRIEDKSNEKFSPWIVQVAFPGIPGQVMQRALNAKGFFISTGSACSSGHKERPVLDAMGLSPEEKESSVRFSFGFSTQEEDMTSLLKAIKEVRSQF